MVSNNSPELPLSDSVWEIIQYIVEVSAISQIAGCMPSSYHGHDAKDNSSSQFSHLESFPGLFDLLRLYHVNPDWKQALVTSNGSRAWSVAASRSLGSAPPFPEDPATAEDIVGAVSAIVLLFSGGICTVSTIHVSQ